MSRLKGFRDVLILVAIALAAGLALSGVYLGTKERIALVKQMELERALKRVCPFLKDSYRALTFAYRSPAGDTEDIPIYAVESDGRLIGAALKIVSHEGFGGDIEFLLGVAMPGKVTGVYILSHKETPGLGTKAAERSWWGQFLNQSLDTMTFKVKKDGGDVDAITAATITSRAVTGGIEKGLRAFRAFAGLEVKHGKE